MKKENAKSPDSTTAAYVKFKKLSELFMAQDEKSLFKAFKSLNPTVDVTSEELESEFNRFFVGPMEPIASPLASVYIDGADSIMTKTTLHVRSMYELMGFTYSQKNVIPDDYLGVELDAYYQLLYLEEVENNTYLQDFRHYFLHEHMNKWIPIFIEKGLSADTISSSITFILSELKSLLIRETTTQGVLA